MKNRSRKRLLTVRAPRNTDQGARIRKLFRSFIAKLNRSNAEHQAMALAAAELTVAAESARALLLAGDITAEQPTVRLENSARRARADLKAILATEDSKKPWDPRSLWAMGVSDDDEDQEATQPD